MLRQPDGTTCGPTCLHSVMRYYGDPTSLEDVIRAAGRLKWGGTLAVLLACLALRRGYKATIFTYNFEVFDPTWFAPGSHGEMDLPKKLRVRYRVKKGKRHKIEIRAYLDFLALGGLVRFEDLTPTLLANFLRQGKPVLTGLSATYLYRTPREHGRKAVDDDVRGEPSGHFVVLCGYDPQTRLVTVADPLEPNPPFDQRYYDVEMDRLIGAIMLGVLTYDANLLVIEPPAGGFTAGAPAHAGARPKRRLWRWRS